MNPTAAAPSALRSRSSLQRWGSLLVLVVLLLWPFRTIVRGQAVFFYGDTATHYVPQKARVQGLIEQGQAPLWNPWLELGEPLAANPSLGVFYPPEVLLLQLFPAGRAVSLDLLAHLLLLGTGVWLWAQALFRGRAPATALLTGLAAGWSGVALSYTTNPQYLYTLAWLPWVLLLARRVGRGAGIGAGIALGWAGALAFYAGDPQGAAIQALLALLVIVACFRRASWRSVVGAMAAAALSGLTAAAVLAWPALELLMQSRRGSGLALAEAADWSFHWWRWITLILPEFFGMPGPDNSFWGHPLIIGANNTRFWFFGISMGLAVWIGVFLLLAPRSRHRLHSTPTPNGSSRLVAALSTAALLLAWTALGSNGRLFPLLHAHLPGLAAFRYPEKYLAPALTLVPLLAAIGLGGLETAGHRRVPLQRRAAWISSGIALLALLAAGAVLFYLPGPLRAWIQHSALAPNVDLAQAALADDARRTALHAAWLLGAAACLFYRPRRLFWPLLIAATITEGLPRAERWVYTTDPSFLSAPTELGRALAETATSPPSTGAAPLRREWQPRPPRLVRDVRVLDPYPWPRGMDGEREIYSRWKMSAKPNLGLLEGIAYATGYSGLETPLARKLSRALVEDPVGLAQRLAVPWIVSAPVANHDRPVTQAIATGKLTRERAFARSGVVLYRVTDALPAAHWLESPVTPSAGEFLPIPGTATTIDTTVALRGGRPIPLSAAAKEAIRRTATAPPASPRPIAATATKPQLSEEWSAARVRIHLSPSTPSPATSGSHENRASDMSEERFLILRDRFAPGWVAHDDHGRELAIYRADGLFRAVLSDGQAHWIDWEYRPASLLHARWVTLGGALIMLLLWGTMFRRRAR